MYKSKTYKTILLVVIAMSLFSFVAIKLNDNSIPAVYHNIFQSDSGTYFLDKNNKKHFVSRIEAQWRLSDFEDIESGLEDGILLDFKKEFEGTVIYGLFPKEKMKYPHAVFFKKSVKIENGKAFLDIRNALSGVYDIANWEAEKKGSIRYRILDSKNNIITNKRIVFSVDENKFNIEPGITNGPFITALTSSSFTLTFWTNIKTSSVFKVAGREYKKEELKKHVYKLTNLNAGIDYKYEINLGIDVLNSHITTAPLADNNQKFSFAFASDSRGGTQFGESDLKGHNAYIVRKMAALANFKDIDFFQFTGDMIDGYRSDKEEMRLEYVNWLRTMSPYMRTISMNVGMGNHEAFLQVFGEHKDYIAVDNFPFETESAEAIFGEFFENPDNGPLSEDGNKYDPNTKTQDFPSYKKNVYSYVYSNTAMIVLNSNYWYTPKQSIISQIGGNPHGYIMDQQMDWLQKQFEIYENDEKIKHVFVTIHTPVFPNGGHSKNDMWYNGNNEVRPYIDGVPVENGIIEQRDIFLDLLVNKSTKFRALLTGDEHNYTRLTIDNESDIYPQNWKGNRLNFTRPFVQIVNGAAGAPYYAQEVLPWSSDLNKFSAQYALVIFNVDGDKIIIEVINPDTLELIERVVFR